MASRNTEDGPVPPELATVTRAAGERLRAETDEDFPAIDRMSQELVNAATSAMGAGYSLTEIARAETRGKDEVRHALSGDALRRVERTGRQAREAQLGASSLNRSGDATGPVYTRNCSCRQRHSRHHPGNHQPAGRHGTWDAGGKRGAIRRAGSSVGPWRSDSQPGSEISSRRLRGAVGREPAGHHDRRMPALPSPM